LLFFRLIQQMRVKCQFNKKERTDLLKTFIPFDAKLLSLSNTANVIISYRCKMRFPN